jgi:hypothetical protein
VLAGADPAARRALARAAVPGAAEVVAHGCREPDELALAVGARAGGGPLIVLEPACASPAAAGLLAGLGRPVLWTCPRRPPEGAELLPPAPAPPAACPPALRALGWVPGGLPTPVPPALGPELAPGRWTLWPEVAEAARAAAGALPPHAAAAEVIAALRPRDRAAPAPRWTDALALRWAGEVLPEPIPAAEASAAAARLLLRFGRPALAVRDLARARARLPAAASRAHAALDAAERDVAAGAGDRRRWAEAAARLTARHRAAGDPQPRDSWAQGQALLELWQEPAAAALAFGVAVQEAEATGDLAALAAAQRGLAAALGAPAAPSLLAAADRADGGGAWGAIAWAGLMLQSGDPHAAQARLAGAPPPAGLPGGPWAEREAELAMALGRPEAADRAAAAAAAWEAAGDPRGAARCLRLQARAEALRGAWRAAEGCLREALGLAAGVSDLSLALEIAAYGVLLSPAPSVRRRWAQVEAGLREAREADAGERTATRATPALQGTNSEV